MVLLVRNRVKDADRWKRVFDAQAGAGAAADLTVLLVWRSVDSPDQVFSCCTSRTGSEPRRT